MITPDMTPERLRAARAEIQRQREQMAAHYPAMVTAGKLDAETAAARIQAVADAASVLVMVDDAISRQRAAQPKTPAGDPPAATGAAAIIGRKLPYDAGISCDEPEPTGMCRFCGARLERAIQRTTGATSYRCSMPGCVGSHAWTHLEKIARKS